MLPRQSLSVLHTPYHQEDFAQYILLLFATQTCSLLSWPTWLLKKDHVFLWLDFTWTMFICFYLTSFQWIDISSPHAPYFLFYSFYIGYPFFIRFFNTFTKWSTYFLKCVCQIRRVSSAERYQYCLYFLPPNYYLFECCVWCLQWFWILPLMSSMFITRYYLST